MDITGHRIYQWMGIIILAIVLAGGYWYWQARAGVASKASTKNGLVGYWSLDEGTGTKAGDGSGNGNEGTLTGGPSWVDGKRYKAVDFDGVDDYVTVADNATLDFNDTADLTLTGWFYRDTATTDDTIIAKRNGITATDTGYIAYIDDADDKIHFEVSDGTDEYELASTSTFTTTGWYHYAIVWDENSASGSEIYINGVADNATDTGTIANIGDLSNAVVLAIGAESDIGNPFDGKLDEVRVYSRALSTTEITALYTVGAAKLNASQNSNLTSGLVGLWSFNGADTTATTATDRSGSGNNCTITGTTVTSGKVGQALSFAIDGDKLNCGSGASLDNITQLTVTGWIKSADFGGEGNYSVFLQKNSGSSQGWFIQFCDDGASNCDNQRLLFKRAFTGTDGQWVAPAGALTNNAWQFFSITYDDSSTANDPIMYINGVRQTVTETTTPTGSADDDSADEIFFSQTGALHFIGQADEMRIYNRILSATEIQSLYYLGAGTKLNTSVSMPQGIGRLDSALVGYWPLDDGSGTNANDATINNNDGTLTGSPPTWTTGQINSGVDFNGSNDYITVPDVDPLDIGNSENFTLAGWFNRDTFTTDDTIMAKKLSQSSADVGYMVYIDDATDKLTFQASDSTDQYQLESVSTFTATGWHHFASVWSDASTTETKLYIDGTAENATATGTLANVNALSGSNANELRFGAESDTGNPFDGKLDEMRLYERALSADEIARLSRLTTPTGVDTSLVSYWSFDAQDINNGLLSDLSGLGDFCFIAGTTATQGKLGQALSLTSSGDLMTCQSFPATDNMTQMTITGWIKSSDFRGDNFVPKLIFKDSGNNQGWYVRFCGDGTTNCDNQRLWFRRIFSGTAGDWVAPANSLANNAWQFFAITYDDSSASNDPLIYINGVSQTVTEKTTPTGSASDDSGDQIQISTSDASHYFGQADEFRIYNRLLSAAEITALYNKGR